MKVRISESENNIKYYIQYNFIIAPNCDVYCFSYNISFLTQLVMSKFIIKYIDYIYEMYSIGEMQNQNTYFKI